MPEGHPKRQTSPTKQTTTTKPKANLVASRGNSIQIVIVLVTFLYAPSTYLHLHCQQYSVHLDRNGTSKMQGHQQPQRFTKSKTQAAASVKPDIKFIALPLVQNFLKDLMQRKFLTLSFYNKQHFILFCAFFSLVVTFKAVKKWLPGTTAWPQSNSGLPGKPAIDKLFEHPPLCCSMVRNTELQKSLLLTSWEKKNN